MSIVNIKYLHFVCNSRFHLILWYLVYKIVILIAIVEWEQ